MRTVAESDARWKVLISPTPLVGPDRPAKHDNHANAAYAYEAEEIRTWLQANVPEGFFVICGDRHWQYHSVHPATGLHEFSVGPASDKHAQGSTGFDPVYHRFHRVDGGFLSVALERIDGKNSIAFRLHDVGGNIVHEPQQSRPLNGI